MITGQHKRKYEMDIMKTILVVLMVAAHVIQFIPIGGAWNRFSEYVNLTTFSGFMFTFGAVCQVAYFEKKADINLLKKLCKRMWITIIAFYISGIAFTLLVSHQMSVGRLLKIIMLFEIPGYSEFLLSFAFLYPLIFVLVLLNRKMNWLLWSLLGILSLLLTYADYSWVRGTIPGVFLGTTRFFGFPIVSYISYFFAGMYLSSKNKIFDWKIFIISIVGTLYFLGYCLSHNELPGRFPPRLAWIVGGYAFVYLYYLISCKLAKLLKNDHIILQLGRHSLACLVISNVVIFAMADFAKVRELSSIQSLLYGSLVYVLCFACSYLWIFGTCKKKKNKV